MATKKTELSKRQLEILRFIESFMDTHGYSPTYREIADHLDGVSTNCVTAHLAALIEKGWVARTAQTQRFLRVMRPSTEAEGPPEPSPDADQQDFIFWRYADPYVPLLGAPLHRMYPDGRAEPVGYPGFRVVPRLRLPHEEGAQFWAKLKAVRKQAQADADELLRRTRTQVDEALRTYSGGLQDFVRPKENA